MRPSTSLEHLGWSSPFSLISLPSLLFSHRISPPPHLSSRRISPPPRPLSRRRDPLPPPPPAHRRRHHDCPTCRGPIPTRRSLRADPAFDAIVSALYERAGDYDLHENAFSAQVVVDAADMGRRRALKRRRVQDADAARWGHRSNLNCILDFLFWGPGRKPVATLYTRKRLSLSHGGQGERLVLPCTRGSVSHSLWTII